MIQYLSGRAAQPAGATLFVAPLGIGVFNGTEFNETVFITAACTWDNFGVTLKTAPGGVTSYTYTVKKNGVAQSLAVTITGAATSATDVNPAHAVTFAAGDTATIVRTRSGVPANGDFLYSIRNTTTAPGVSIYGFGTTATIPNSTRYNGIFSGSLATNAASTFWENVVPTAGDLTRYDIRLNAAPGAGTSYVFTLFLNGVKQDGSGGTVNTQLTIANLATSGSATFTLPLVAGDLVYLEIVPTSSPTARAMTLGSTFTATIDGESLIIGSSDTSVSNSVATFCLPTGNKGATEANADFPGDVVDQYRVGKLYVNIAVGGPGTGNSYTVDGRNNTATPAGAPSVTITDLAVDGNDTTHTMLISPGDLWDLMVTPASTPTARVIHWGLVQSPAAVAHPGFMPFLGAGPGATFTARR